MWQSWAINGNAEHVSQQAPNKQALPVFIVDELRMKKGGKRDQIEAGGPRKRTASASTG